jgi:hypothetical protein
MRTLMALVCSTFVVVAPSVAWACGVSSPGAPVGVCDASDVLDAKTASARTNRIGVSGSYTTTALFLSDGSRVDMQRDAAVATFSFRADRKTNLELGAGALVGGTLGNLSLRPGGLASLSVSWRIVDQRGAAAPFFMVTGGVAAMFASTSDSTPLGAIDFRVGAMVGTTIGKPQTATLTPYLAVNAFGGPLLWSHRIDATHAGAVLGGDAYHYALGGGLAASISRIGLFAGGSAIGERSLTFGASVSF